MHHPKTELPDAHITANGISYTIKVPETDYKIPSIARSVVHGPTVCCRRKRASTLKILNDLSFVCEPGTATLVRRIRGVAPEFVSD